MNERKLFFILFYCLYYFKILNFHMKIIASDYDFRFFLIKCDFNLCLG